MKTVGKGKKRRVGLSEMVDCMFRYTDCEV